jgi:hypothetical protein
MTDWHSLRHAYGNADDLPALLDRLSPDPEADVWERLWSRICHQGTVYSASFAALPALANYAERWSPTQRYQALVLAAFILASTDVCGGSRNKFLRPVEWVAPRLRQLCNENLAETGLARHEFIYLLQAARSFEGDQFWGHELDHLVSGEFTGTCPHYGVGLFLVIGEYGFFTTPEEWVQLAGDKPSFVVPRAGAKCAPIEPRTAELPEVGRWLFECSYAAQQNEVAHWIRCVFGTTACPSCGRRFEVQDAIGRPSL